MKSKTFVISSLTLFLSFFYLIKGNFVILDYLRKRDFENISRIEGVAFSKEEEIIEHLNKKFAESDEELLLDYFKKHYIVRRNQVSQIVVKMGDTIYLSYIFDENKFKGFIKLEMLDIIVGKIPSIIRLWMYSAIVSIVIFLISFYVAIYALLYQGEEKGQ